MTSHPFRGQRANAYPAPCRDVLGTGPGCQRQPWLTGTSTSRCTPRGSGGLVLAGPASKPHHVPGRRA
jgi:hypothetical protein